MEYEVEKVKERREKDFHNKCIIRRPDQDFDRKVKVIGKQKKKKIRSYERVVRENSEGTWNRLKVKAKVKISSREKTLVVKKNKIKGRNHKIF